MNEEFKLEQQDPRKQELEESERKSEQLSEEVFDQIQAATTAAELEKAILNSENHLIIARYYKLRFQHLKDTNTFEENGESHLNNLEIEKYDGVNENGYLKIDEEITTAHLEHFDDRRSDAEFLATARPKVLALLSTSEDFEQAT